jgi:hypothetical protein
VKYDTCKLCLQKRDLQLSHFLPAAVFKSLLASWETNPHPYFMSGTRTIETSRQMKDYLLCPECEQRFNENGEKWVLAHMAREEKFLLQDLVQKATPIRSIAGLTTYAGVNILGIDLDKLEYFGLSVFWRAAVHTWEPGYGEIYEPLELGPYQEPLRQYLLGVSPFPKDTVLMISVFEGDDFLRSSFPPAAGERRPAEGRPYSFAIPGIQFSMVLGKQLTKETREFNSHQEPERRIFLTPLPALQIERLKGDLKMKQLRRGGLRKQRVK